MFSFHSEPSSKAKQYPAPSPTPVIWNSHCMMTWYFFFKIECENLNHHIKPQINHSHHTEKIIIWQHPSSLQVLPTLIPPMPASLVAAYSSVSLEVNERVLFRFGGGGQEHRNIFWEETVSFQSWSFLMPVSHSLVFFMRLLKNWVSPFLFVDSLHFSFYCPTDFAKDKYTNW